MSQPIWNGRPSCVGCATGPSGRAECPKMLRGQRLVERRQEEEEQRLHETVCQCLKRGIPAASVAGALGESPVLGEADKDVFRDWVDMAYLRAAAPALKSRRRAQLSRAASK